MELAQSNVHINFVLPGLYAPNQLIYDLLDTEKDVSYRGSTQQ